MNTNHPESHDVEEFDDGADWVQIGTLLLQVGDKAEAIADAMVWLSQMADWTIERNAETIRTMRANGQQEGAIKQFRRSVVPIQHQLFLSFLANIEQWLNRAADYPKWFPNHGVGGDSDEN